MVTFDKVLSLHYWKKGRGYKYKTPTGAKQQFKTYIKQYFFMGLPKTVKKNEKHVSDKNILSSLSRTFFSLHRLTNLINLDR